MRNIINFLNSYIFGPGLCLSLFICGIFLCFYLRFFFLNRPKKMLAALKTPPSDGMSAMKAMLVALAGTLGVGNIAGVASAIAVGGAGAVFWMLVSSVAAIPVKYAEIVLARRHRHFFASEGYHGGAFWYIKDLGGKLSSLFAMLFALLCICASLSMGCTIQSNALAVSVNKAFGISPLATGIVLGIITLFVASGGLSRISFVTSKLVPLMSIVYILMSAYIIIINLPLCGEIVTDIAGSALTPTASVGGVIGFMTSRAVRMGITRGIVSNEAGCGTAPIAHSESSVNYPAVQGVWGILEVIIDTPIMCTLTAMVVLIGQRGGISISKDGMAIAVDAFGIFIPFSEYIICAAVSVFAFCTIICWFFYGTESLRYINKRGRGWVKYAYLAAYSVCTVIGSVGAGEFLWELSDLIISFMTAVNLVVLLICRKEIKSETISYFER